MYKSREVITYKSEHVCPIVTCSWECNLEVKDRLKKYNDVNLFRKNKKLFDRILENYGDLPSNIKDSIETAEENKYGDKHIRWHTHYINTAQSYEKIYRRYCNSREYQKHKNYRYKQFVENSRYRDEGEFQCIKCKNICSLDVEARCNHPEDKGCKCLRIIVFSCNKCKWVNEN